MKTISTEKHPIYIGNDSVSELNNFLFADNYSSVFILVDENTKKHCLTKINKDIPLLKKAKIISIKSGEKNKNFKTCVKIWTELLKQNADRRSLLINLGGGMISDIGGFAASTFKRGIDFINIPTTLLAQTDASSGGKTGVDFNEYKNQIGTFAFPKAVFIIPSFLKTLDKRQLLSGFAEVLKHALVADRNYWKKISTTSLPLWEKGARDEVWEEIISRSIQIKNEIVSKDPYENGLRKALNFGHTIGHAIESLSLRKDKKHLLHGEAIAIGMMCESYLSRKYCGLPSKEMEEINSFILSVFNPKPIKHSTQTLLAMMKQDKKNRDSEINFTLLSSSGKAEINNSCSEELIEEAIKFFNSLLA
ncbi:MAG: 3-dehydroquinate synthase [Bacteroidetes bacterium]|nr:3-dehydroquinate synthase [Bacteroidota bacterium]